MKEQAIAEGIAEGRAEGIAEGRAEGFEEGMEKAQYNMAKKMKADNVPYEIIVKYTGLSVEEIENIN